MSSSYQPFLISTAETGLYNYTEPWIRPTDAFDPLENAYVYRGDLVKRDGYTLFGVLTYRDNGIALITGTNSVGPYTGTLAKHPIRAGSMTLIARTPVTSALIESFTDNGAGVLTGSAGGTGTINYSSGAYSVTFNAALGAGIIAYAAYTYTPTALSVPVTNPIMGIKEFSNENTDLQLLVVCDTKRAALYNNSTMVFDPISSVSQTLWIGDNTTTTIDLTTNWTNIAPDSVTITDGTNTIHDDGLGAFPSSGNFKNTTTIDYTTGIVHLEITTANTRTYTITFSLAGNYFTGDNTKFFNAVNWLGNLYLTNNVNPITLFDGTILSRPPFPITQANSITFTNNIGAALDVNVYKNRFVVVRPTLINNSGNNGVQGQSIRWSKINVPTNLIADVTGNGGELSAPTDDWINTLKFLRDIMVAGYDNSTYIFRFTQNDFNPFRFDKVTSSKSNNAPYAAVEYDERVTNVGHKGLIACDGVNVQRYDISIIDQFLDINQAHIAQCFSQRYDTANQVWTLYPSIQSSATTSDKVLIYNIIENTWATFDLPLSCLGLFYNVTDLTWATSTTTWETSDFTWESGVKQAFDPILLGGDQTGNVFRMYDGVNDNGTPITTSITSVRWNPFVAAGQRVQFGYIDFYYAVNPDVTLQLEFFDDDSSASALIRSLTLDSPNASDDFAWKRVYINVTGEFLRMNISDSSNATWKITGMLLWARQSGRLTP